MDTALLILFTAVLAVSHYLSPLLKKLRWLNPVRLTSFAGGVAVGYVFLHMLPEMVEQHDKLSELLAQTVYMTPFKDLAIFIIALLGFEVFYLFERWTRKTHLSIQTAGYRVSVGMYFFYNFLITYTLAVRIETGWHFALLFIIAMSLHFILSDNHFKRYYPHQFGLKSHLLLIAGLVLGCVLSAFFTVNVLLSVILSAFLSGAVLYNAFSEEISIDKESSPPFFFLGTIIMASLLAVELLHL